MFSAATASIRSVGCQDCGGGRSKEGRQHVTQDGRNAEENRTQDRPAGGMEGKGEQGNRPMWVWVWVRTRDMVLESSCALAGGPRQGRCSSSCLPASNHPWF